MATAAAAAAHPLAKLMDSDAAGNVRQTLEDGRTITNYADGTSVMRTKNEDGSVHIEQGKSANVEKQSLDGMNESLTPTCAQNFKRIMKKRTQSTLMVRDL